MPDSFGHDEDCNLQTGAALPYDPLFLDPRPHRVTVWGQSGFASHGEFRPATSFEWVFRQIDDNQRWYYHSPSGN